MNKSFLSGAICACVLILTASATARAAVIEFGFSGQFTAVDPSGNIFDAQTPISSTFTYDTDTGFGEGSTGLFIAPFAFFGLDIVFHDISMERITGTEYLLGNMLVDVGPTPDIPVSLVWDATGLLNAIDYGLLAGDVISGTDLKRGGIVIADVNSQVPATDGSIDGTSTLLNQGPAPLAMTTLNTTPLCTRTTPIGVPGECMSIPVTGAAPFFDDGVAGSPMIDGPFPGFNANLDLGSGNSLTVLSISSVPVPGAVWLFGSGLLGLVGLARHKKA